MITLFDQNGFERQLDSPKTWDDYKRLIAAKTAGGTNFDTIQLIIIREDGETKHILCNEDGEMLGTTQKPEPLMRNGMAYKRFQYLGFPRWWGNVILLTGKDLLNDEDECDDEGCPHFGTPHGHGEV